jgi:hypothetical protein
MFGDLIINYNASKMASVPLSSLVKLDKEAPKVVVTPAIYSIRPTGARRGSTRRITIKGSNIPRGVKLEAAGLTFSNVSTDGTKVSSRVYVERNASLGTRPIIVRDSTGAEIGRVNFSVYRRGGGTGVIVTSPKPDARVIVKRPRPDAGVKRKRLPLCKDAYPPAMQAAMAAKKKCRLSPRRKPELKPKSTLRPRPKPKTGLPKCNTFTPAMQPVMRAKGKCI